MPPLEPSAGPERRRWVLAPRHGGLGDWLACLAGAGLLCFLTFYAKGGLNVETLIPAEIVLTLLAGVVLALGALRMPARAPAWGLVPALLLAAFAVLSAVSLIWSVQPEESLRDAGRLLAYTGVFAAAVMLVRIAPARWPAVLGALILAAVAFCTYALVTKALPDHFAAANKYARLYEPFGYWNAIGLAAAMGAMGCMWLGGRRAGHALLSALAYPAMGLLLTTLMLAYSRGALVALALGLVLWFVLVPLRLRGAAVLIAGGLCAGAVTAWDFSNHALSSEGAELAERVSAGHQLGALVLAMVALLTLVGVGLAFASGRHAPSPALRERFGMVLVALLTVGVLAFCGALAHSQRGFTGSISHAWHSLTNTHASVPNTPGRLTAIGSVRAAYWDQALKVFKANPGIGVGAGGYEVASLRYREAPLTAKHAHGFVFQTLADLGIAGALIALALLLCWLAAAGRSTHPFNRRWRSWREVLGKRKVGWERIREPYGPERVGLLSMVCIVFVFGVHSFVDWTWYVPGVACAALFCAGWLAGRGPLGAPAAALESLPGRRTSAWGARAKAPGRIRLGLAAAAVAIALLSAWAQWQPKRSESIRYAALDALGSNAGLALKDANAAVSRDPLSIEALFTLAEVQQSAGQMAAARATLQKAVRQQPSNPETWLALGRFDLTRDPSAAMKELGAFIYLNPEAISPQALAQGEPEAIEVHNDFITALRASKAAATARRERQQRLKSASERHARAGSSSRRAGRRHGAAGHARSRSSEASR
ncbi:MAG TPA: O-antigen ligase family protein [Solirubrobacteraceae bacterium]